MTELPPLGWECPRCHVIHGPRVTRCSCTPPEGSLRERIARASSDLCRHGRSGPHPTWFDKSYNSDPIECPGPVLVQPDPEPEPAECEHGKVGPHQVRDTYALVICPGPVRAAALPDPKEQPSEETQQ